MLKFLIFLLFFFLIALLFLKISIKISLIYRYQHPIIIIQCRLPFGVSFRIYPRERKVSGKMSTKEMENIEVEWNSLKQQGELFPILWQTTKVFLAKMTCSKFEWHTEFGTGAADKTAQLYGMISAIQYGIVGRLMGHIRFERPVDITITPYFTDKHFHMTFSCMLHFRLGKAIGVLFYFLKAIRKQNQRQERNRNYGASNSRFNENSTRKFG